MAKIVVADKSYRIDNLKWADKKGDCDQILCRPNRKCGYEGGKKKCISQLVGHSCKHFINAEEKEKEKIDSLLKTEKICDEPQDTRKSGIIILPEDEGSTALNRNNSVQSYEKLCRKAEKTITEGWISRNNIQLACGDRFKGYTIILNEHKEILSFYYANRLDKESNSDLEDHRMYNLIKKALSDYNAAVNGASSEVALCNTFSGEKSISVGGEPIDGEFFYEKFDGFGFSSKVNFACSFRNITQNEWANNCITLFYYHYDPMLARTAIELYDFLKKEENSERISSNLEKYIIEHEQQILNILKLYNLETAFSQMQLVHTSEEKVYAAAYGKDEEHILSGEMKAKIGNILIPIIKEDIAEIGNSLERVLEIEYEDNKLNYNSDEADFWSFLLAEREEEQKLLDSESYVNQTVDNRFGNVIPVIMWKKFLVQLY